MEDNIIFLKNHLGSRDRENAPICWFYFPDVYYGQEYHAWSRKLN